MSPLTLGLLALAAVLPPGEAPPPPLSVAAGLGSHANALRQYDAANRHLTDLERYLGVYQWDGCHPHVAAAHAWRTTWDYIGWATDPERPEWERRQSLAWLVREHGWRVVLTGEFRPPALLTGGR